MVRYLYHADYNQRRIRKVDRMFHRELDFKDIKCPVKITDIQKIENKNCIRVITIFGYKNKTKFLIYVSRTTFETHIDLLLPEDTKGTILFWNV